MLCAVGGFYIYVVHGFPLVPNPYVASYHKYVGTVVMFVCYFSYYKACAVEPGYFSRSTDPKLLKKYISMFEYDNLLYNKDFKCRTCTVVKPARSKHCTVCDACVLGMDHHCIWINQCVGHFNYKWFLAFIFFHALLTLYGFVAGFGIFLHIIDEQNLFRNYFVDTNTGRRIEPTYWIVFNYLMSYKQEFGGVVVLCGVCTVMLFFFFVYHMDLVRNGVTTNEKHKMSALRHYLKKCIAFFERWIEMKEKNEPFEPKEESLKYYGVKKEWDVAKCKKVLEETKADLIKL